MSKPRPYESVAKKAARGKVQLMDPLDYKIMEQLPAEGTLMGGLIPIGESVRQIVHSFGGLVDHSSVSGRLQAMRAIGYVVVITIIKAHKGEKGWQITPLGAKALREWQARQKEEDV